jgi:hypothetical protein
MRIIKVATDNSNAYFDIVSRLKRTHLRFSSISPSEASGSAQDLIVTTKKEAEGLKGTVLAVEDLDQNPLVMEGQLLSLLLDEPRRNLLVGIDPGSRIGVVVFYGGRELGTLTENSVERVVELLVVVAERVPHSSLSVKIGGGEPKSSKLLAYSLREALPSSASIEIVDESGTSASKPGAIGATRDQKAAVRIAFRRGVQFTGSERAKRTRG